MYYVEKSRGINYVKQFDYLLFGAVLLLTVMGIFVLSSATKSMPGGSSYMKKQIFAIFVGIIMAIVISIIDYKDFKVFGAILYFIGVIALVLVLFIGVGKEEWGSRSWLDLRVTTVQPSEPAKVTFIIMAAIFLERISEKTDVLKNIIKLAAYSAIPVGLILLQPDAGTAMVYMFAFAVMVFLCGIPYKVIFAAISAFIASTPLLWMFVLKPHQKKRILTFIFPGSDSDASYQVDKARIAIGSGKLFGKGLYEGIQTQAESGGVPIKESDFIFTVVGEELGFIGALVMIILIYFILMRCLYIAKNSRDKFGSFLVAGVTAMFAFHFIENIGMCVGVLPVTGIPLPFVSYAGTAMITNYVALGIVLSVSMRRKRTLF